MNELAESVLAIVKDYRNEDGIQLTVDNIVGWAEQFGEDAEFMLKEILHILPQIYLSRTLAKKITRNRIHKLVETSGSITTLLSTTEFMDLQPAGKSQGAILALIDEILSEDYGQSFRDYLTFPKTNFIFFDDVLATGATIGRQLTSWLNESIDSIPNHVRVLSGEYRLSVRLFCLHTWGHSFQNFIIGKRFSPALANKIEWFRNLEIQNHTKWNNQRFNIAIPSIDQPQNVRAYLASLSAEKYEDYAYRPKGQPREENFFSSVENRVKYENLLLQKGIEIINMIHDLKDNVRPLGFINPSYKTFGLGTHFVTWRNIPNNCPLALWWEVNGHNWKPLFKTKR